MITLPPPDAIEVEKQAYLKLSAKRSSVEGRRKREREGFFEFLRVKFRVLLDDMDAERRSIAEDRRYWAINPEAQLGRVEL